MVGTFLSLGLFVGMKAQNKIPYPKSPLSIPQQRTHLTKKKLNIDCSDDEADKILKEANYYRLSAYFVPFYEDKRDAKSGLKVFLKDTNFTDCYFLYKQDESISNLFLTAIKPIEVYFRASIAHTLTITTNNPFPHHDEKWFKTNNDAEQKKWWDRYNKSIQKRENHPIIQHFNERYTPPNYLPLWVAVEFMEFGTLSHLYKHLLGSTIKPISEEFTIDPKILCNYLRYLNDIRNQAAHHSRLFNFGFAYQIPKKDPLLAGL